MSTDLNRRRKIVNGIEVDLWGQSHRHDTDARRLAAALPRAMSTADHVESACTDGEAVVWLNPPEDGRTMANFEAPEGWQIEDVSHFSDGTLAVDLSSEADR